MVADHWHLWLKCNVNRILLNDTHCQVLWPLSVIVGVWFSLRNWIIRQNLWTGKPELWEQWQPLNVEFMSENMAQGFGKNIIFVRAPERLEFKLPSFMISHNKVFHVRLPVCKWDSFPPTPEKSFSDLFRCWLPELLLNSKLCGWVISLLLSLSLSPPSPYLWVGEQLIFTLILSVPPKTSSTVNWAA